MKQNNKIPLQTLLLMQKKSGQKIWYGANRTDRTACGAPVEFGGNTASIHMHQVSFFRQQVLPFEKERVENFHICFFKSIETALQKKRWPCWQS